jgi:NAD(P)-dependent dehydrogenase (short-subunit alcohol dehydrogenase family)
MPLNGRHALVTGGGTGIGTAIARALAAEGAKLTLVGRRRDKLEEVAADIPGAFAAAADVTEPAQVRAAFAAARAAHGPVSILVNNAGFAQSASFAETSPDLWRRIMAVNLDALLHCCQAALPDLLAADAGRIVTIASTAALQGFAYTAAYTAAKHGALGLTRALAAELAKTKVTVNAVCPGFTDTPLLDRSVTEIVRTTGRSPEAARETLARMNPNGRIVAPEEVAAAVVRLCLLEGAAVTGQAIVVGGEAA